MRNSAPREEIGECDLGTVFIHSFAGTPVGGRPTREKFEVRAGNHTIATKDTHAEAEALAHALVGNPPAEAEPEPAPALETAVQLTDKGPKGVTRQAKPKAKAKAK